MKGIIYCRVSSAEQVQGTSLENQKSSCLEYARQLNIEIVDVFIERGESATAATRTELIRALDFCKRHRGQIAAFIVWKIDRFARNTIDHYALQAELRNYGTTLHSVTEPIGDNPIGKMTEAVLAGYAQFENDIRKQRCEAGMRRKISEGIWPWQPPLGYVHGKKLTDRRKNTPDEADPERFELIQRGLKQFAAGDLTISALARLWNHWGLRTRTGKPVFKQLAERLIKDKYFAGILIDPWTKEEYVGLHPAMITPDEFDRIQYFRDVRSRGLRAPRLRNNPDFPLRHFVSCICGAKLTGAWHKGRSKRYARYFCTNPTCTFRDRTIQKAFLETEFKKELSRVTPSLELWDALRQAVLAYWQGTERHTARRSAATNTEIATLQRRKDDLLQLRVDNEITPDEYLKAKRSLELKITEIQLRSPEQAPASIPLEVHLTTVDTFITRLPDLWDRLTQIDHKQALQRVVYPNGMIYDANIRAYGTAILSPLFSLFGQSNAQPSYLVAGVGRYWHQLLNGISNLARIVEEFESGSAVTSVVGVEEPGSPALSRHYRERTNRYKAA
jgi:site-specific DNA recombinase